MTPTLTGPECAAFDAIRTQLDAAVARRDSAGLQYLVVRDGAVLFEHNAGWADAAAARPVDPRTTFNLYSITKPFTAALVLDLVRGDRSALDRPIAEACGVPALARYGTLGQTLLHRAGFGNPLPLRWFHLAEDDETFDETAFVDRVLAAQARRSPRGPAYSNPGYLALGRTVERACGQAYRRALQNRLLDALALAPGEHLGFAPASAATHACGHLRRRGATNLALGWLVERQHIVALAAGPWVQLRLHHVDGSAYGGLLGNARGLARFGAAVLGTAPGLAPAVRADLLADAPGPGPKRTFGGFRGTLAGEPWVGHAGGGLGGYGELRLYPGRGTVSVLLTNAAGLRDRRQLDPLDAPWLAAAATP